MSHRFMVSLVATALLALPAFSQDPGASKAVTLPPANSGASKPDTAAPANADTATGVNPIESPLLANIEHENQVPGFGAGLWFSADYEFAWIKGTPLPPLVTTSPAGTAQANAGVLGKSTTTILLGDEQVDSGIRAGMSLDAGYWFNPEQTLGIQTGFRMLESQSQPFGFTSNGTTILARPFTDANTSQPVALLIGYPGVSSGSVTVVPTSHNFQGFHIDMEEQFNCSKFVRLEGIVGYRYYRYDEDLDINETMNPTSGAFVPGTVIQVNDHFGTKNEFNGGEFGLRTKIFFLDRLSLEVLTQVDAGQMTREVTIAGRTTVSVPGATPTVSSGGLLALSSNIGNYTSDKWVAIPEIGAILGWQITPNVKFKFGYSFLSLSQVARPGDQIDLTVNQTLLPNNGPASGPSRPAFTLHTSDVWVQSLNLGLEFSF
ncbi:MAG TPA: BBP7 family outer membrane beta-barrel protein [Gemmataceae bacterium]|nr:BBP7 family outer membrane beta-barrel protein [Gemmataceae bacterium]